MSPPAKKPIDLSEVIKRITRATKAGMADEIEVKDRDMAIDFIVAVKENTSTMKRLISACVKLTKSINENTDAMFDDEGA